MNQDFLSEGQRALCWATALSLGHSLTGVGKHPWITGLHPSSAPARSQSAAAVRQRRINSFQEPLSSVIQTDLLHFVAFRDSMVCLKHEIRSILK